MVKAFVMSVEDIEGDKPGWRVTVRFNVWAIATFHHQGGDRPKAGDIWEMEPPRLRGLLSRHAKEGG